MEVLSPILYGTLDRSLLALIVLVIGAVATYALRPASRAVAAPVTGFSRPGWSEAAGWTVLSVTLYGSAVMIALSLWLDEFGPWGSMNLLDRTLTVLVVLGFPAVAGAVSRSSDGRPWPDGSYLVRPDVIRRYQTAVRISGVVLASLTTAVAVAAHPEAVGSWLGRQFWWLVGFAFLLFWLYSIKRRGLYSLPTVEHLGDALLLERADTFLEADARPKGTSADFDPELESAIMMLCAVRGSSSPVAESSLSMWDQPAHPAFEGVGSDILAEHIAHLSAELARHRPQVLVDPDTSGESASGTGSG